MKLRWTPDPLPLVYTNFIFKSYDIINSFQLSLRSDRELKQRKQQKVPNFTFCRGREHKAGNDFLFLFLNFDIFF